MTDQERKPLDLTAENVFKVFSDCLLKEEEIKDGEPICEYTMAEGIISDFVFNKERLNQHIDDIIELIEQLPSIEQGPSFLNLCINVNGTQWGEHRNVEQLVALGVASNKLRYCLPKEMWSILPGGMPFVIGTSNQKKKTL